MSQLFHPQSPLGQAVRAHGAAALGLFGLPAEADDPAEVDLWQQAAQKRHRGKAAIRIWKK